MDLIDVFFHSLETKLIRDSDNLWPNFIVYSFYSISYEFQLT